MARAAATRKPRVGQSWDMSLPGWARHFHPVHAPSAPLAALVELLDAAPEFGFASELRGAASEPMADAWCFQAADLADQFAHFYSCVDGSKLALWLADGGAELDAAPIVLIESEGQHQVLADDVAHFVAQLAHQRGPTGAHLAWDEGDEVGDHRPTLIPWALAHLGLTPAALRARAEVPVDPAAGSLADAFAARDALGAEWNQRPEVRRLAQALAPWAPAPDAKPWQGRHVDLWAVGDELHAFVLDRGPQAITLPADAVAVVHALRAERAQRWPGRGRWQHGWLTLSPGGALRLACDWMRDLADAPASVRPTPAAARAAIAADGRTAFWTPGWAAWPAASSAT
jgi:hypothetical protein